MSGKNVTEVVQADTAGIGKAARILKDGGLVVVPTETVYGLAARADMAQAVASIYAAKGRPDFNPLIVHVQNEQQARELALFDHRASDLAKRFWPGPLTMVLPLRSDAPVAKAVTAGLPTIAIRQPEHPVMRALLAEVGRPLAAPSANRSEHISPTRAQHVIDSLGHGCPLVIDGGASDRGVESTIVALRTDGAWSLLRRGPIDEAEIAGLLGRVASPGNDTVEAPGQLARHYSPGKPVRLNAQEVARDEFWIGFGGLQGDCNLSAAADLNEAAANLYECLHQAAAAAQPRIAIASVPEEGIGAAINDRLRRAATPAD